jgi:preprotein translocase subunit SecA
MKSTHIKAGKRLAYIFSTAQGVPIIYDLSSFTPTLDYIRSRSQQLSAVIDLGEALRVTLGSPLSAQAERMALVVAAFERYLGVTLFDGQILAGLVLSSGGLLEMATGEGKTFAAAMAAVEWAVSGQGCHVLTANDYLAERDCAWLQPVYAGLGLSCSAITEDMDAGTRRMAYRADITYLTAPQAVYDYLRDGLVFSKAELRQRPLSAAIVDEADFLMIDQARAPLVIAGCDHGTSQMLSRYSRLVESLESGSHYAVDQRNRRVALTLEGQNVVAKVLKLEGMHRPEDLEHFARVHAALYARCLLVRDIDYLVRDGCIELVDRFTGRVAEGRRWPYGVQAAVETLEQVPIQTETGILGSITLQRFFPLYSRLAAMTATAVSAAEEFNEVYGLPIYLIPSNVDSRRVDAPDRMFLTMADKEAALMEKAAFEHASGRPVLLVTASVAESEQMAAQLRAHGIACQVLNAKHDREEAEAIARAGCLGTVTVSTEMAGRGTDIRLGGPKVEGSELDLLLQLGGLCILVSGRRESRRHDDQLRGRAGRQGEPGHTCFFTSLEDPLFKRYGVREFLSPALRSQLEQLKLHPYQATDGPILHDHRAQREMDRAQRLIEAHMHHQRTARRRSSQLLELQRRRIASWRNEILHADGCMERQLRLKAIDQFWQKHLALAEDIREGIHLASYGGRDPEREFDYRLDAAFLEGLAQLESTMHDVRLSVLEATDTNSSFLSSGCTGSTWTYQVDEEPLPAFSLPALSGVGDIVHSLVQLPLLLVRFFIQLTGKKLEDDGPSPPPGRISNY